ncbi:ankyrin repeat domain-containing protein [Brachyspira hampsonii]|uniref:ankyrin repeat domain-containing protein n=1 Tax=Brachyspira hampsonii TaxID=1287055 RepID=UPI0002AE47DA|nr:ankyrin repeat domain-containing protein [Brachyspira hampsonii]ELV06697.1 ankyrin [Brachyspira hampsonii 30599]
MKITKTLITIIFSLALFNSLKLIRTGTDVNTKDDKRVSALMYAVKSGNLDLVK